MRTTIKYLLPVCFAAILFFSSCRPNVMRGSGNKGTVTPTVATFSAIDVPLSLKVIINVQSGAQPSVRLNGYENIIGHIKTKIENNSLTLYSDLDETWRLDCDGVTAEITVPSLTALSLSGAPDADIHGNITGPSFKLDISGSSDITIDNINVDNFSSDVSGVGNITVNGGTVKHASYELSGASKIKAFPLQTEETETSISGTGKGEVTASQKLIASISGAGTVSYKGHPAITQEVSGVGKVKDAN